MNLLNSLLETAQDLANQSAQDSSSAADSNQAGLFLDLLQDTLKSLDAQQREQVLELFKQLATGLLSQDSSDQNSVWDTFKESPVIREWAGTLTQNIVQKLATRFLTH